MKAGTSEHSLYRFPGKFRRRESIKKDPIKCVLCTDAKKVQFSFRRTALYSRRSQVRVRVPFSAQHLIRLKLGCQILKCTLYLQTVAFLKFLYSTIMKISLKSEVNHVLFLNDKAKCIQFSCIYSAATSIWRDVVL